MIGRRTRVRARNNPQPQENPSAFAKAPADKSGSAKAAADKSVSANAPRTGFSLYGLNVRPQRSQRNSSGSGARRMQTTRALFRHVGHGGWVGRFGLRRSVRSARRRRSVTAVV